jgi:hypothetical protein
LWGCGSDRGTEWCRCRDDHRVGNECARVMNGGGGDGVWMWMWMCDGMCFGMQRACARRGCISGTRHSSCSMVYTRSPSSRCGSHSMARSYNSIPHTITLIRSTPERPSTPLIRGDCVARVLLLHSMLPQRHHEHSTVATHTHTRTHTHTHTHTHTTSPTHTHTQCTRSACTARAGRPSRRHRGRLRAWGGGDVDVRS